MDKFLYIDPGTGSMLFSLAIGIATAGVFAFRALLVKIRFIFSGGKKDKVSNSKIPFVIFSDHKRYWNVFKPLCDEFEKRKISLVYLTQSKDDPVFLEKYQYVKSEYIGEGNKGFVRMNMLNAGTVISTTPGLDVLQWKRSKNVDRYIHIPHSCDDLAGYRMFALDFYDSIFACGQNQIDFARKIEKIRNLKPKDIQLTGATFMDAANEHIKLLPKHDLDSNNLTILLAPSWGPSGILSRYGEKLISAICSAGFNLIVRPHPQSFTSEKTMIENLMNKFSSFNIEWNKDNDNLEVLNRADVLITDFSGIILDWTLLFNRPLIYADTHFDPSVYDGAWFEEKFWIINAAEKVGLKLTDEMIPSIKSVINDSLNNKSLETSRNEVKFQAWGNIGNSAKTIVDLLVT